jgi:lipopolysaccharide export system protein LptA
MYKIFFTLVSLILFCFVTAVNFSHAETKIGLEAFRINPKADIEITSQSMQFNNNTNVTEFFDNVNITYGQLILSANSLTVSQSNGINNSTSLTIFASGPIIINNKENIIRGDKAVFIEENQELTIYGNVSLIQKNNKMFGERLVLNLKDGVAKISGSVRTIITPTGKN